MSELSRKGGRHWRMYAFLLILLTAVAAIVRMLGMSVFGTLFLVLGGVLANGALMLLSEWIKSRKAP
jgi:hypothetical protein